MARPFTSKAALEQTVELIAHGRADEAEAQCRSAIARNPRDVNMLALLGALLVKTKRPQEAEQRLRQAIELAPTFAKPHEDLGYLLVEQGRPAEAAEMLERATRLDPKLESAWFTLGKARAMLGQGKQADAAFERSFELSPLRKTMALAAEHHKEGRLNEAERLYREVLRQNPRQVDALRLLGMIAFNQSRPEEAERLLTRALRYAPDFVGALIDLGRIFKEQDRYEEAIDCFRRAIAQDSGNAQPYFLLGATLAPAALTYDAIDAYRKSLELRPDHAGALLGLGHVLKAVGRQEEGIDAYRCCARLKPDNGEVYWSLANLKTYRFSDAEFAEMQQRLAGGDLSDSSRVNFLFALAKACEDRGDYDQAWRYYRDGSARQRALVSYDPVQTEMLNDRIIDAFSAEFLEAHAGEGLADPSPIFIVGLPRSGSTLLEQILASHSRVEGTSELPYIGRVSMSLSRNRADGINYPEAIRELQARHLRALGEDYISYTIMHRREGAPHFIDKMPNNFPNVGLIHLMLPNARIIDARRHPLDACLGCYRQLFAKGQNFTYDLTEIGEYYLEYQRLMDHWHAVLPGRVLTVQYEEVISDLEGQVRRILDYCGLAFEQACLRYYETERPVRTASSEQVRRPIYSDSIGRWRRYEHQLGELIEVLDPILPRYGQFA